MRWALVTGTSSGLGQAIAARLLREGASVFAGVRRRADPDRLPGAMPGKTSADGTPRLGPKRGRS